MTARDIAEAQLRRDEGVRYKPYTDTVGKVTIGTGRNLTDNGIRVDEADLMLSNDIESAIADCLVVFPSFPALVADPVRQATLLNFTFAVGRPVALTFGHMRQAVAEGNWDQAAKELLASLWALEVGARAQRLAAQLRTGVVVD